MSATPTIAAMSDAESHADSNVGQSYVRLAAAAHVLSGALAWGSHANAAPAAAAITLASCVALWTAFASVASPSRLVALALSVVCILVTSFATYVDALPDWLVRGPWNPIVQSFAVIVVVLVGGRRNVVDKTYAGDQNRDHSSNEGAAIAPPSEGEKRGTSSSIGKRCAVVVGVALVGYLVALPVGEEVWDRINPPPTSGVVEDMTLGESMRLRAVQVFAAVWAFAFGACVGSFLNVLVYRQPRGESVLAKPSACPACSTKIETRDNLPVIGWLLLGGRCRSCQSPISPRYPIVEAIVGLVFAILVFAELTSGGANLPVRRVNTYTGFVWTIFYPKWDLIALTLYHFHLFVMLITWALMAIDRVTVPWRSIITSWVIAMAAPLAWNRLWVMPPGFIGDWIYPQPFPVVAAAIGAGVATGAVVAAIAWSLHGGQFRTALAAFGLVGATLGWQAVVVLGVLAVAVHALVRLMSRADRGIIATLVALAFAHQLVWRPIVESLVRDSQ